MHHLNNPQETFFASTPNYDNTISPRSIFFADAVVKLNNRVIVTPSLYYSQQAKASEFVGGLQLNYNVVGAGDQQLIGALFFRPGDAYIPMVGYQWKNFKFMFSYDVSNSPLKYFNNSRGATEMYMQYDGIYSTMYGGGRQSMCPTFTNGF
jgi:hypothetical protein